MPLSQLALNASLTFAESVDNTGGFVPTTMGTDSVSFNLGGISLTTYNQLFAAQYTIAVSGTQTIDLTTLTNFVCESFSFNGVISIMLLPTGSSCTLSPGASNALQWFFGGTTQSVTVPAGGLFVFSAPASGPSTTVDGTHKTLKLANAGAGVLTVDFFVLGSA